MSGLGLQPVNVSHTFFSVAKCIFSCTKCSHKQQTHKMSFGYWPALYIDLCNMVLPRWGGRKQNCLSDQMCALDVSRSSWGMIAALCTRPNHRIIVMHHGLIINQNWHIIVRLNIKVQFRVILWWIDNLGQLCICLEINSPPLIKIQRSGHRREILKLSDCPI